MITTASRLAICASMPQLSPHSLLLLPFSQTPLPQVSDIDGTMIGDMSSPDAFTSSHRFAEYWENSASLAGSLLVYNTGEGDCILLQGVGPFTRHLQCHYGMGLIESTHSDEPAQTQTTGCTAANLPAYSLGNFVALSEAWRIVLLTP